ncbi:MAG TPA: helix-hairpin-helix domain-containing protein [Stellaceae bacterium]|nr:helix-hairpin-helix domain-containing protein [Stellaceae bacterium]
MSKFFRLPLTILALTIAGPVLAAEPLATSNTNHNSTAPAAMPKPAASPQATVAPNAAMVDINNASAAELKALPGITDADAGKIVQGRPYKEPSDLVTKKILPDSAFSKIKDRVTAGHSKS